MGPGWIEVEADALSDQEQLSGWVGVVREHNRAVTAGHP